VSPLKAGLIFSVAMIVAVFGLLVLANLHEKRITELETGPSCTCRPIQTLLKNRPYPPPPGVKHSFARPFDTCEL
jgi:hypothetical protein